MKCLSFVNETCHTNKAALPCLFTLSIQGQEASGFHQPSTALWVNANTFWFLLTALKKKTSNYSIYFYSCFSHLLHFNTRYAIPFCFHECTVTPTCFMFRKTYSNWSCCNVLWRFLWEAALKSVKTRIEPCGALNQNVMFFREKWFHPV